MHPNDPPSSDVGVVAKALMSASGDIMLAKSIIDGRNAAPRVQRILEKAAISAGALGDGVFGEVLADWRISEGAFFASLRNESVYFRLLDSGFRRVPLRTRLGVVAANATGWIVGEGAPAPVSSMSLENPEIAPVKACALIVFTDAVARSMDDAASNLVNQELRAAVTAVVDAKFFDLIIDSETESFVASGTDETAIRADLRLMVDAVNTKKGALVWAMSSDVANALSLAESVALRGMTPLGGELLGLPGMVSDVIPAGTLRLINAGAIAAAASGIGIDVSTQADIQMVDNPAVDASAALVSLFQTNNVALKALVTFAVERTRSDAVAELTGIAWGPVEAP